MDKLTKKDIEMIIFARKYLDDARACIDYSDESKAEITMCMDWLTDLKTRFK